LEHVSGAKRLGCPVRVEKLCVQHFSVKPHLKELNIAQQEPPLGGGKKEKTTAMEKSIKKVVFQ